MVTYLNFVHQVESPLASYATKAEDGEYLDGTEVMGAMEPLVSSRVGFRTPFQLDRDRIQLSPYFPTLARKTQVFIRPTKAAFTTRMTHTLHVVSIARTISRGLSLNEDLTEAIALGHDLGHAPFGHAGERILNQLISEQKFIHMPMEADLFSFQQAKFSHGRQSVKILTYFQKEILTKQVVYGIGTHSAECNDLEKKGLTVPVVFWTNQETSKGELNEQWSSFEAQVVRLADDIAWICGTLKDAQMAGIVKESEIVSRLSNSPYSTADHRVPSGVYESLLHKNPFTYLVNDAILANLDWLSDLAGKGISAKDKPFLKQTISFSKTGGASVKALAQWVVQDVHQHAAVTQHDETARRHLGGLYAFFSEPKNFTGFLDELSHHSLAKHVRRPSPNKPEELLSSFCDYVSICSDDEIVSKYKRYCVPDFTDIPL